MSREDELVMVVKRDKLFADSSEYFSGFQESDMLDFESRIVSEYSFVKHKDAQQFDLKQPIPYCLIVNPVDELVFFYQRTNNNKKNIAKKFAGQHSIGSGRHIGEIDTLGNPIRQNGVSEVLKELEIYGNAAVGLFGYINNDSNPLDKFHFTLVYLIKTDAKIVTPTIDNDEILFGEMIPFSELENKIDSSANDTNLEIESWSKILVDPLRKYLTR